MLYDDHFLTQSQDSLPIFFRAVHGRFSSRPRQCSVALRSILELESRGHRISFAYNESLVYRLCYKMTSLPTPAQPLEEHAQPAWEVATLFPAQGTWSEEDYLVLPTNRLVEFSHGEVDVLPMPSQSHQLIVLFLYRMLYAFVSSYNLGTLLIAPLRIRLWPGKFREPDLVLMLTSHDQRRHQTYWEGADLVVEVVSPDDPRRDLVTKRLEYAQAGIPEYWIVDPEAQHITVLQLENETYVEHGQFGLGATADSVLLAGFAVQVDAVFAAG